MATKHRDAGEFFVLNKGAAEADAEVSAFLQQALLKSADRWTNGRQTARSAIDWPALLCLGLPAGSSDTPWVRAEAFAGGFSGVVSRGAESIYFKVLDASGYP